MRKLKDEKEIIKHQDVESYLADRGMKMLKESQYDWIEEQLIQRKREDGEEKNE